VRAPIEIEIAGVRLDEIRDLPLGPPPGPSSERTEARPRPRPHRRASRPLATPADEGEVASKDPSRIDRPGHADQPDAVIP
jgi:hypothetical protein